MSKKISALPLATNVDLADVIPVVDVTAPATTKQASIGTILALATGGPPAGAVGDLQFKGLSGFDASPTVGRIATTTIVSDADPFAKTRTVIGHVTTTDDDDVEVVLGPQFAAPSSYRVDIVITAFATVAGETCLATFAFGRMAIRYGGGSTMSTELGDLEPVLIGTGVGEGSELEGIVADVGSADGNITLELTGLDAQRITWGWKAEILYLTEEPS